MGQSTHSINKQHQVTMAGLVWAIHEYRIWADYHIEALSSPPKEVGKNMVDEDRMILMREKMNVHVLSNIRSFNIEGKLFMFTCTNHPVEWTQNSFMVTS